MSSQNNKHYDSEINNLIESNWGDFSEIVNSKVGHLKKEYLLLSYLNGFAIGGFVVGLFLLSPGGDTSVIGFISYTYGFSAGWTIALYLFVLFLLFVSIFVMLRWSKINKAFNLIFNPLVFGKAFAVLGFDGQHLSASQSDIIALLNHSELITEAHNVYMTDDMVVSKYNGRALFVAELDVKNITGSGKSKSVKKIFHGVLIAHELPQSLIGKTFITTEGDIRGFGNISLGRRLFKTKEVPQETVLEWNDFENKLHVATTDATEARYILTPDFMESLFGWWSGRKGKIRVSFIDNRLYVLYADKRVRLDKSVLSLKEKGLKDHVLQVARPLWHAKELMECIEVRFRNDSIVNIST